MKSKWANPFKSYCTDSLHAVLTANSLFAVGLMPRLAIMTGQILSGVSPLIAIRDQIMVMCMAFDSTLISGVDENQF